MDALRERYDPDAMIVRGLEGWPEQEPAVGREAVMRYFVFGIEGQRFDAGAALSPRIEHGIARTVVAVVDELRARTASSG